MMEHNQNIKQDNTKRWLKQCKMFLLSVSVHLPVRCSGKHCSLSGKSCECLKYTQYQFILIQRNRHYLFED